MPATPRTAGIFFGMGWNTQLHPWNLTWNLKITCLKRKLIFQTFIFGFHVNFQGCNHKFKHWDVATATVSCRGFSSTASWNTPKTMGTWRFVLVPSWRAAGQRVNPRYTGPENQLQTWRCSKMIQYESIMKLSKSTRRFRQLKQTPNLFGCWSHTQHSSEALITRSDVIVEYSW